MGFFARVSDFGKWSAFCGLDEEHTSGCNHRKAPLVNRRLFTMIWASGFRDDGSSVEL